MSTMASQITSLTIVYSTSLAFVQGIHRWPVNSLHKGPVTRKMFPFDDVIMYLIFVTDVTEQLRSYANTVVKTGSATKHHGTSQEPHQSAANISKILREIVFEGHYKMW